MFLSLLGFGVVLYLRVSISGGGTEVLGLDGVGRTGV